MGRRIKAKGLVRLKLAAGRIARAAAIKTLEVLEDPAPGASEVVKSRILSRRYPKPDNGREVFITRDLLYNNPHIDGKVKEYPVGTVVIVLDEPHRTCVDSIRRSEAKKEDCLPIWLDGLYRTIETSDLEL